MKALSSVLLFASLSVSVPGYADTGRPADSAVQGGQDYNIPRQGHIIGKVQDRNGVALPGVAVMIKGTSIGVETNAVGNYDLDLQGRKEGTIVFSCLGYSIQEINYTGQTHLNVTLQDDLEALDEIVVTGYGNYNRSEYVGAVTQNVGHDVGLLLLHRFRGVRQLCGDGGIDEQHTIVVSYHDIAGVDNLSADDHGDIDLTGAVFIGTVGGGADGVDREIGKGPNGI